jgi:nucleoside-diphosphate-sugar epimerase
VSIAGKSILVTGASGFIGTHVCRRLLAAGASVVGCRRRPAGSAPDAVEWRTVDVRDPDALGRLVAEVRPYAVIHLASRVSGSRDVAEVYPMFQANLASTVQLLGAAEEVGARVVLAGSTEEPFPGASLETPPRSPYAVSKWAAAAYVRMFGHLWGVHGAVLRPSMVYGPEQMDVRKLVPYTIVSLLRGESPRLASGRRMSDWVYVADVADAFVAAIDVASPAVPTLDVGSGEFHSVRHVVNRITEIIGNGIEPIFGTRPDPPDEAGRPVDLEKASETLGWRAGIGLDQGLRETIAWYSNRL